MYSKVLDIKKRSSDKKKRELHVCLEAIETAISDKNNDLKVLNDLENDKNVRKYKSKRTRDNSNIQVNSFSICVSRTKNESKTKYDTTEWEENYPSLCVQLAKEGYIYSCAGLNSLTRNNLIVDIDDSTLSEDDLKSIALANGIIPSYIRTHVTNGHKQIGLFIHDVKIKEVKKSYPCKGMVLSMEKINKTFDKYTAAYKALNTIVFPGDPGYTGYNCQNPAYENEEYKTHWIDKDGNWIDKELADYDTVPEQNLDDIIDRLIEISKPILDERYPKHSTKVNVASLAASALDDMPDQSEMEKKEKQDYILKLLSFTKSIHKEKMTVVRENNIPTKVVFLDEIQKHKTTISKEIESLNKNKNEILNKLIRLAGNKENLEEIRKELYGAGYAPYDSSYNKMYFVISTQVANIYRKKNDLTMENIGKILSDVIMNVRFIVSDTGYTREEETSRIFCDLSQIIQGYNSGSSDIDWDKVGYTPLQRALSLISRRYSKTYKMHHILLACATLSEDDFFILKTTRMARIVLKKVKALSNGKVKIKLSYLINILSKYRKAISKYHLDYHNVSLLEDTFDFWSMSLVDDYVPSGSLDATSDGPMSSNAISTPGASDKPDNKKRPLSLRIITNVRNWRKRTVDGIKIGYTDRQDGILGIFKWWMGYKNNRFYEENERINLQNIRNGFGSGRMAA